MTHTLAIRTRMARYYFEAGNLRLPRFGSLALCVLRPQEDGVICVTNGPASKYSSSRRVDTTG